MKKIAILTCLNSNRVCTGASCLKAMNERKKAFSGYQGQEVELMAFMHCNGCGTEPEEDKGLLEKIERLEKIGVETVHVGICGMKKDKEDPERVWECPTITKIVEMIEKRGISVIRGTH